MSNNHHHPTIPAERRYAHIVGWGKYVPEKVMTNEDISKIVDTNDEWIQQRTGIRERRIADPKETASTMGLRAAKDALWIAGINPSDVELVIVATATPDYIFPATACLIQDALGAAHAGAFDLSVGCAGFVYALSVASSMISSGMANNALVIGSETLSRVLNWADRGTCVLFGDGAGAFVLRASEAPGGVLASKLGSDGSGGDLLMLPGGGGKHPFSQAMLDEGLQFISMDGAAVFKFATRVLGKAAKEVCELANLSMDQIDLFIPHQANQRIIASATKYLKLPEERVMVNVQKYGNTSAASIPIAFCEAVEQKRLKAGDHFVLVAFGAGLSWAACAAQFDAIMPESKRTARNMLRRWVDYNVASARSFVSHGLHHLDGVVGRERNKTQTK
ncbi:MAG TPA: beta-ketoacyl-ACP synthase III [Candidatus Eremiobacteraceae bacterium]|nr:beta-ketoacyl-ACP synthase III [Candidatus Eremiobacteraceae bacterium]